MVTKAIVFGAIRLGSHGKKSKSFGLRFSLKEGFDEEANHTDDPAHRPAVCASAFGQRVEIFGGAQFGHLQPSYNAVGWNGSVTGNFRHVLGITADFSGVYKSHAASSSVYTYTVGPVFTARLPVVQPFVHGCLVAPPFRVKA